MLDNNITSEDIYNAFLNGAMEVVSETSHLNSINVFPIQDGDTGNNLSSMMRTMINESKQEKTVKETLESFSDAAILGARGNSGIIFAQYLNGLSVEMSDEIVVNYAHYAKASQGAVRYAYESIESPVEGTMLTVMKEWGEALVDKVLITNIGEAMSLAVERVNKTLEYTQYQLKELKKAKVVDAGAKGFTLFVEGILKYFKSGVKSEVNKVSRDAIKIESMKGSHDISSKIKYRYCTECLLEGTSIDPEAIKKELHNLGDSLVVAGNKRLTRIHMHTNSPQKAFEILNTKGNIRYQKVDDMQKQQDIVQRRKSDIAILTDSIADLPAEFIDKEQIHILNLNILFNETYFIDKLTITPAQILELSKDSINLPTSSQPDEKHIENILNYLSDYYKSLIVITVSSKLSGAYNTISRVAKNKNLKDFKITVIDSKQNSGAEGLLVEKAANLINSGLSHNEIVSEIYSSIPKSKILVRVKTLDNMIRSGRLSTNVGRIGKRIGLRPIVTLDAEGDGGLGGIAFTDKGSLKRLIQHIKKKQKTNVIESYNIVHINNLEEAKKLEKIFTNIIGKKPNYIVETSSIVAVGAGNQTVALSYILE